MHIDKKHLNIHILYKQKPQMANLPELVQTGSKSSSNKRVYMAPKAGDKKIEFSAAMVFNYSFYFMGP